MPSEKIEHLAGTTYHKISGGWKKFWEDNVPKGVKPTKYCPCSRDFEDVHELTSSWVGAHVVIRKDDRFYFAVVPACKKCNNVNNVYPVNYECTAVTILNLASLTMAGHIHCKDKKSSFSKVNQITSDMKSVTLKGLDFNGNQMEAHYDDPDSFLLQLASVTSGHLVDKVRKSGAHHKPTAILLNKKSVPKLGKKPKGSGKDKAPQKPVAQVSEDPVEKMTDKMSKLAVDNKKDKGKQTKAKKVAIVKAPEKVKKHPCTCSTRSSCKQRCSCQKHGWKCSSKCGCDKERCSRR